MKTTLTHRGKDTKTGEWIYGNLLGNSIIIAAAREFKVRGNGIYVSELAIYHVEPSTVHAMVGED